MKPSLRKGNIFCLTIRVLLVLLLPVFSYSQTFFGVSSTPADNGTNGTAAASITPPPSMVVGDLVVVYAHYRGNSATINITNAGGQSWFAEVSAVTGSTQTYYIYWCRYNGTWSANPVFTGPGTNGMSAIMYVYRPTLSTSVWGVHIAAANTTSSATTNVITGLTTTAPNTVTMAFWGNALATTWSGLTGTPQWSQTGISTQYRNIAGTDQSHSAAYSINTVPAIISDVSQVQAAGTNTLRSIISWSEIKNDLCANAIPLELSGSCTRITGSLSLTTSNASGAPACGNGSSPDVWYRFVARTTNPTISLSNIGTNLNTASTRIQLLSGTCGSFSAVPGTNCTNLTLAATGLTIGVTYYIRITTNSNTAPTTGGYLGWDFDICVVDPGAPANDNCTAATALTSTTTCASPTAGNVLLASTSSVSITAPNCVGTVYGDVWYSFVAQTTNPTITLALGTGFTTPGIQLLSNNCGGTFTTLFCSTTNTLAADYLVLGTTYYIRVYSTSYLTANGSFTICVRDPVATVPPNDEYANAINLLTNPSCSDVPGTVSGSTNSGVAITPCTAPVIYDVWYKFTAISTTSTITMSAIGSNFNTPRMQLLTSALGHIACGTTSISNTTVAGTTYYVRVYSASGSIPNGNADFNICVAGTGTGGQVRSGNSYVNITRKTTGGVVQVGDILEIRMTINHTVTSGTYSRLRFVDNLPTNTVIASTAPHDSIRVITNEGLTYRKYQINAANDPASYIPTAVFPNYNIRLNLGFGGSIIGNAPDNTATNTTTTTGTMSAGSNNPRGGGGMLFAIAYRVQVTGAVGQKVILNAPRFIYYNGTSDVTLTGTPFEILISDPLTLCANSIGVSIASESGGTFGSGTALNRSTDLSFPITGYSFVSNMNANNQVGDGRYAIVKNMSPRSRTDLTARREPNCNPGPVINVNDQQNCNNRMYGHWEIAGDHTGTSTSTGNAPPSSTTSAGYMLMVNADYVASEIYKQTIPILCPNTYYEFSAWIRNICPTCGIDSVGDQFDGTPTAPAAGYPGVLPNLTFALDGVDYYNTGEVDINGWQKRGFVFKTGPTQTSAIFSIRNNSQGGGGNDWVLDDIAVATCFPNMTYSPSASPNVCENNVIKITDTVRSYFNNYVEYKWERSTSGSGGPWVAIAGASGTATPTWNATLGLWEFVSAYNIPPTYTNATNDGDLYRLVVASTTTNLASTTCSYTDPTTITLNVIPFCGPPLKADLLSATGRLNNNISKISWTTSTEDEALVFHIERSDDGVTFRTIGSVNGYNDPLVVTNYYNFTDPVTVTAKVYYRVVMTNINNGKKYSSTIQLNPATTASSGFSFGGVANPFSNNLQYEIQSGTSGLARIDLIDANGKIVRAENQQIFSGSNSLSISNTTTLPAGMYVLRALINGNMIFRKVIKN